MNAKRRRFLAMSLAGIGAIGAFASVSAASLEAGTPKNVRDKVQTAIKQAFTNDDYQSYLAATKDIKSGVPVLSEAQFNAMVKAQKLRARGDAEGANKLLTDAGIKPPIQLKSAHRASKASSSATSSQSRKKHSHTTSTNQ